jgi:hypothetical protein
LALERNESPRPRRRDATIPAIAQVCLFLVGVDALVDFSLRIQAVALTYIAVLAAGVVQARDEAARNLARAQVQLSTARYLPGAKGHNP